MAKRLKNVKVNLISLLTDKVQPSNMQGVIVKSDGGFGVESKITKFDDIKGLLYVTVMKSQFNDTDDEFYEDEDVIKAAHDFMKQGLTKSSVDNNHNFKPENDIFVVESNVSFIEKGVEWKAVLDISENSTYMEKARKGLVNGVSIAGTAQVEEVEKMAKAISILDGLKKAIKEKFKAEYCWLRDVLSDGTAIAEVETKISSSEDNYGWQYKLYKQAYAIAEGKIELVGEATEVKENVEITYLEKQRKELETKELLKEINKKLDLIVKKEIPKEETEEKVETEEETEKECGKPKKEIKKQIDLKIKKITEEI